MTPATVLELFLFVKSTCMQQGRELLQVHIVVTSFQGIASANKTVGMRPAMARSSSSTRCICHEKKMLKLEVSEVTVQLHTCTSFKMLQNAQRSFTIFPNNRKHSVVSVE